MALLNLLRLNFYEKKLDYTTISLSEFRGFLSRIFYEAECRVGKAIHFISEEKYVGLYADKLVADIDPKDAPRTNCFSGGKRLSERFVSDSRPAVPQYP
jgi:hypothetical protein